MPYPIHVGSILEARLTGMHQNQLIMNVLHYQTSGATIVDGFVELAQVWGVINPANKLIEDWRSCMSDEVKDIRVYLQWIAPTRYAHRVFTPVIDTGGVAVTAMPTNVSATITRKGVLANRSNLGVLHLGGLPTSFVNQGFLTINGQNALDLFRSEAENELLVNAGATTLKPVIFNRANPANSVLVAESMIQKWTRTMRRRTVGSEHKWGRNLNDMGLCSTGATVASHGLVFDLFVWYTNEPLEFPYVRAWGILPNVDAYIKFTLIADRTTYPHFPYGFVVEPDQQM